MTRFCLVLLAALRCAAAASAQTYPDKPIKMIVPFPPGGPIDTMGRVVAQNLSTSLGQQVVIEPGVRHHVAFELPGRFQITFCRAAEA